MLVIWSKIILYILAVYELQNLRLFAGVVDY